MAAEAMDDIADRFADRGVTSVFIYVREAHPAENYRHHSSMEVKRANARAFRDHSKVRRSILLDDVEGTVHHLYGLLPNTSWIISTRGRILYKADWTSPADIEEALAYLLDGYDRRGRDRLVPMRTERTGWRESSGEGFRAGLVRNGPQAVRDFYGSAG